MEFDELSFLIKMVLIGVSLFLIISIIINILK